MMRLAWSNECAGMRRNYTDHDWDSLWGILPNDLAEIQLKWKSQTLADLGHPMRLDWYIFRSSTFTFYQRMVLVGTFSHYSIAEVCDFFFGLKVLSPIPQRWLKGKTLPLTLQRMVLCLFEHPNPPNTSTIGVTMGTWLYPTKTDGEC